MRVGGREVWVRDLERHVVCLHDFVAGAVPEQQMSLAKRAAAAAGHAAHPVLDCVTEGFTRAVRKRAWDRRSDKGK